MRGREIWIEDDDANSGRAYCRVQSDDPTCCSGLEGRRCVSGVGNVMRCLKKRADPFVGTAGVRGRTKKVSKRRVRRAGAGS